jgi:hypothetical protein
MMGRQTVDQRQLFYLFNLEDRIPDILSENPIRLGSRMVG